MQVHVIKHIEPEEINALSPPEEDAHDECMGETDLDSVYQPIPSTFQDSQVVMIRRVRNNRVYSIKSRHWTLDPEEEGERGRGWDGMELWPCSLPDPGGRESSLCQRVPQSATNFPNLDLNSDLRRAHNEQVGTSEYFSKTKMRKRIYW